MHSGVYFKLYHDMDLPLLRLALASAQVAAQHNDREDFVVGVCVAQSQLGGRLDLVRLLDQAVQSFPRTDHFDIACHAITEAEDLGQLQA